jgi:transposase-like protein
MSEHKEYCRCVCGVRAEDEEEITRLTNELAVANKELSRLKSYSECLEISTDHNMDMCRTLRAELELVKEALANRTVAWEEQKRLRAENSALRRDSELSNKLCALLINHAGESGQSEGAVEVLTRKLADLATSELSRGRLIEALEKIAKFSAVNERGLLSPNMDPAKLAQAALSSEPPSNIYGAMVKGREALRKLIDACKNNPTMQNKEKYDGLGIEALAAMALLNSALGTFDPTLGAGEGS